MCQTFEDENALAVTDDILQPLSIDRFVNYKNVCAKQLPEAIRGHHFLLVQERWIRFLSAPENQEISKEISARCKFHVYVPKNGDVNNCTFIALTEEATDEDDYVMFVFTLQKDFRELNECFRETKRIKWTFGPLVASIHTDHFDEVLVKFMEEIGLKWDDRFVWPKPSVCMWLPKGKVATLVYEIPKDLYAAPLTPEHAEIINNEWPHKTSRTANYIRSNIILNDGVGLFDKKTNNLLSWVITNDNLVPGFLQTIDSAEGRGLAKLLMKIYFKDFVARENVDILAYIWVENFISRRLFQGLGLEDFKTCSWSKIKPLN